MSKRPGKRPIRINGNTLFLTRDTELIRRQLDGEFIHAEGHLLDEALMDDVSTDEIIPGWCCFWYDQKLSEYAYLGLRGEVVNKGTISKLRPAVVVSGNRKGCGSSREHAVYAEKFNGVKIVFAKSFEKIYQQNCRNAGIITSTDFALLRRLLAGETLCLDDFTKDVGPTDKAIIEAGGLFRFSKRGASPAIYKKGKGGGALNIVQKIVKSRIKPSGGPDQLSFAPGKTYAVDVDVRFSHEYVTPMAASMFYSEFGAEAVLEDPASCFFFQDHLTLSDSALRTRKNGEELLIQVKNLNDTQEKFAIASGGNFIGPSASGQGSRAICHNYILENVANPGNIIVGTDSHSCTAGALGAFAFGVGASDIANSWYTGQTFMTVPRCVAVYLEGQLGPGVCAKDVVLSFLRQPIVLNGETSGCVLVFKGPGCATLNIDERATLCNMSVEAGAITALFEPDDITKEFVKKRIHGDVDASNWPVSDLGASFDFSCGIDLTEVEPMVSLPGDPKNSVPIDSGLDVVYINKAYGGSCTGGKASDMDMYAEVFSYAMDSGAVVGEKVEAFLQMGSETVMRYAKDKGYMELFEAAGVQILPPSCGACINAGPGVSDRTDDITVSAQNRNFPGRSGPGKVYLASPYVVASSAIAGRLLSFDQLKLELGGER